jgi:hypothetical protein
MHSFTRAAIVVNRRAADKLRSTSAIDPGEEPEGERPLRPPRGMGPVERDARGGPAPAARVPHRMGAEGPKKAGFFGTIVAAATGETTKKRGA